MSGNPHEGDAGWLRYESKRPGEADAVDAVDAADPGLQDQRADTPDSPWLRHDLANSGVPVNGVDGTDGAVRDTAWLPPELEVAPDEPTADEVHDTGVPPTLVEPELPTPAEHQPSSSDRAREAAPENDQAKHRDGDADDERVGGLAVLGAAVKEFAIVVGMALVLSFIVKTWLLKAFYIPSGSMEDTLLINDRVIVSKLTPGPIDLERGDIVVFADPGEWLDETPPTKRGPLGTAVTDTLTFVGLLPDNAENHLIKRVIGLPGDKVVCCDQGGRITINGTAIKEPYLKPGDAASEQDFSITVPRGRVWVMGDHRSNSADSRVHDGPENDGAQGSVDERLIVGRAVALVWPLDHLTWLSTPTATFAHVPPPQPGEAPAVGASQHEPGAGAPADSLSEGGAEMGGADPDQGVG